MTVSNRSAHIYSDGDVEKRLLALLDEGKSEDEIIATLNDSAIFHTFSPAREGLLNWYPFKKTDRVLEVGAGMGALTGLLCRTCGEVVALEMSPLRAEILRKRYASKNNLLVVADDINAYQAKEKFDRIVVVGVLEYAAIISQSENPYVAMLQSFRRLLKPDGVVLLAIENRFGLKYWCGAQEDHTGIPFEGIEGYLHGAKAGAYSKNGVSTFDHETLDNFFEQAGFLARRFYYPFPDYKFPMAVFTDSHLPSFEDIRRIKFSYSSNAMLIADERSVWQNVIKNNATPFFANSFLVEAACYKLPEFHVTYATYKRDYNSKYHLVTKIDTQKHVDITCTSAEARHHLVQIHQNYCSLQARGVPMVSQHLQDNKIRMDYIEAPLASTVFQQALREGRKGTCLAMIDELKKYILLSSEIEKNKNEIAEVMDAGSLSEKMGVVLKTGYVDMTFVNFFATKASLLCFDQEWAIPNIPVSYILFRAVCNAYIDNANITKEELLMYAGVDTLLADIYAAYEQRWLAGLMDCQNLEHFDPHMYHEKQTLAYQMHWMQDEIERVNQELCKVGAWGQSLDKALNEKSKQFEELSRAYQAQAEELNNKTGHVELLLQTERDNLAQISQLQHKLEAFQTMPLYRHMLNTVLPASTRRRFVVKMVVKVLHHPVRMLSKLNHQRFRKLSTELRNGDISLLNDQVTACIGGTDIQAKAIDVCHINETASIKEYAKLAAPHFDDPTVSIVIPVYNQFSYTYACIQSILQNSCDVSYEIILADDCSTDQTTHIEDVVSGLRIIRTNKNLRFLLNCNNAAKYARGKYILFLNNDTQVQSNWLKPLITLIESSSDIGMVGSKLVYPDGRLQEAGGIVWNDGSAWNYGNKQDASLPQFNYVKEVDYISGASIMIRAELWKKLNGFDTQFAPAYYEDTDLAFSVRKAGYRVMFQPLSVVVHFEGISNGNDVSQGLKSYQVRNQQLFREKWENELRTHKPNAQDVFYARERSFNKKVLLFVDHYVPEFDKDAGSRSVFGYIKLFLHHGYSVKFIGDNYYHSEPYTTVLQQLGVEVLCGDWYYLNWKTWLKENAKYFDYAFLNRPHIAVRYIDILRSYSKAKIIYYGHDLHFLRTQREYDLTKQPSLLQESNDWRKKEFSLMQKADVVYYPSHVEVEMIHRENPAICAKAIPVYLFDKVPDVVYKREKRKDLFFIGGFAHKPNVDAVKWFSSEIMPLLRMEIPDIRMHVAGSHMPEEFNQLDKDAFVLEGRVTDERLEELYEQSRMIVIPLRFGAGVKGKVIEGMFHGVPIITTSCGAEGIQDIEKAVCIKDTAEQIAHEILVRYNDGITLADMSKQGIMLVRKYFTESYATSILSATFDF